MGRLPALAGYEGEGCPIRACAMVMIRALATAAPLAPHGLFRFSAAWGEGRHAPRCPPGRKPAPG